MPLQFRNVDASPDDEVRSWPYEALVAAIDRGLVGDWHPIFAELRSEPWGVVARRVEHYLSYRERDATSRLFELAVEHARIDAEEGDRRAVAARVRAAIAASGLSAGQVAELVGTSASRMSTYANGKVTPSAAMLLRIERRSRMGMDDDTASAPAGADAGDDRLPSTGARIRRSRSSASPA